MKDLAARERLGGKFTFSLFIPHGRGLRGISKEHMWGAIRR